MKTSVLSLRSHFDSLIMSQLMIRPVTPHDHFIYESNVFRDLVAITHALKLFLPETRFAVNPQDPFALISQEQPLSEQNGRALSLETVKHFLAIRDFDIAIVDNESPGFSGEYSITFTNKQDGSWAHARLHLCQPGEQEPVLSQPWDAYFILEICQPLDPTDPAQGIACIDKLIMPRMVSSKA